MSVPESLTLLSSNNNSSTDLLVPFASNCYLSPHLEPISSPTMQGLIFWLYIATAAFALVGNCLVIIVQLFGNKTAPNMRKYLSNLAVADVITGVFSVPFSYTSIVRGHWPYGHWLCPTAQFVQLLSVFLISTTLSIIGIERYIITVYPLSRASHFLKCHSTTLLALFWLLGAIYAYIPIRSTRITEFEILDSNQTFYQCIVESSSPSELFDIKLFIGLNFSLTFLLPLLIISASYVAIMRRLKACTDGFSIRYLTASSSVSLTATNRSLTKMAKMELKPYDSEAVATRRSLSLEERSKQIIKIMFTVILLFCICWFPVKLFQFMLTYHLISYCTETEFYLVVYSYVACHWLAMANSCINPLVYSFASRSFRSDLKQIIAPVLIKRFEGCN